ncbi:MAG: hypothetical protein WAV55_07815 [Clostridiaceae bacterium]
MTEEKKKKNHQRDQITFYETFDDEIVRISGEVSFAPEQVMGGPRPSYTPTPVIPGFYTLSDAFENARRRLEAMDMETSDPQTNEFSEIDEEERDSWFKPNSMINAVTPGYFTSEFNKGQPAVTQGGRTNRKSIYGRTGQGSAATFHQHKNYILVGDLIEELTDDEMVQEKSYSEEQRLQQSKSFDFVLDETMRSLIEDHELNNVKLG